MSFIEFIPEGFLKNGEWVAENVMAIDRTEWAISPSEVLGLHKS